MAPELLVKGEQPSVGSDIYALGMVLVEVNRLLLASFCDRDADENLTCFQLFTLAEPFAEFKRAPQVVMRVFSGGRPRRPSSEEALRRGLDDGIWALMEACWAENAEERPDAVKVKEWLEEVENKRIRGPEAG